MNGPLFFASSNDFFEHFDYGHDPKNVVIDLTHVQIWNASSVAALDGVQYRYEKHYIHVEIIGLDDRSSDFHKKVNRESWLRRQINCTR